MRRKLTLPVEPPVATITALRARILRSRAVVIDSDAEHAAGIRRLAMDRGHAVLEQNFDAGLARRGFERPHQPGAGTDFVVARIGRPAGLDHRPVLDAQICMVRSTETPIS